MSFKLGVFQVGDECCWL